MTLYGRIWVTPEVSLIITELNMPVMDGIEFIRQVRARPDDK